MVCHGFLHMLAFDMIWMRLSIQHEESNKSKDIEAVVICFYMQSFLTMHQQIALA
jgi:hypothetical protein